MIKKILLLWIRFALMVVGLSYWASFISESIGPRRSFSYAAGTLAFSLLFAVIMETVKFYNAKKTQSASHIN